MSYLRPACLVVLASILLSGCKGTGILLVPSKDDVINSKLRSSSAFLDGFWQGKYEDSKVEAEVVQDKGRDESCSVTVWIYDKDKKLPMIPMRVFVFAVKDDKYVIFLADAEKLVKGNNYSPFSGGFLYPVMKIFKLTQPEPDKLSLQEIIFTKKLDKEKVVTLSPNMKMWGENSNMIYGTSSEVVAYLEAGKYELSKETVLTKAVKEK
ncbi:MAG: hypothetical protein PHV82_18290 [Victivallaceae bacterium]|nr:hypothetical protein [Victivallaceae bacterium]